MLDARTKGAGAGGGGGGEREASGRAARDGSDGRSLSADSWMSRSSLSIAFRCIELVHPLILHHEIIVDCQVRHIAIHFSLVGSAR